MKARTIALLSVLTAAVAVAQTAPPSQKVAPDGKPAASKAAPASPMQAKPAATKAKKATRKAASKPAAEAVKKAAIRTRAKAPSKRDPFVSTVREEGGVLGPNCTTGKKCLAINSIVLRGIVKSQAGMIAVVESSTRHLSYFLRESDPVFNGYVVKITGDTIVFRENVVDRMGKTGTRDVVMKVVAPAV